MSREFLLASCWILSVAVIGYCSYLKGREDGFALAVKKLRSFRNE
jgi:hypothetical protein